MRNIIPIIILSSIVFLYSCKNKGQENIWSIPSDEVLDGGPGQDGIPSVDNPEFSSVDQIDFMEEEELISGVLINDKAKGYPHGILNWHEVVNDDFENTNLAMTYCPLTGTAIVWDRSVNGSVTEFGVSGLLYNTNLIAYDRNTESNWSQIQGACVNGELIDQRIETHPVIETTWSTWKKLFPDAQVMNTNTGFSRNYDRYPYGDYIENHDYIIFPLNPEDNSLPSKERVFGVIGEQTKVYPLSDFGLGKIIYDQNRIIIGSQEDNFCIAFENDLGLNNLEFSFSNGPIIASSNDGTIQLDIYGNISGGTFDGQRLTHANAFTGYWLAFGSFFPDVEIYE